MDACYNVNDNIPYDYAAYYSLYYKDEDVLYPINKEDILTMIDDCITELINRLEITY